MGRICAINFMDYKGDTATMFIRTDSDSIDMAALSTFADAVDDYSDGHRVYYSLTQVSEKSEEKGTKSAYGDSQDKAKLFFGGENGHTYTFQLPCPKVSVFDTNDNEKVSDTVGNSIATALSTLLSEEVKFVGGYRVKKGKKS